MICNPGTLRTQDPKGRPLCLAPDKIFPVIRRHYPPSGEAWSEITIIPHHRRVIVAENPQRLARRIGKAVRALQWASIAVGTPGARGL